MPTAIAKKKEEEEFSVDALLDSVATATPKEKKSSVVEISIDEENRKLVKGIRIGKEQVKSLTSILKLDEAQLYAILEPLRAKLLQNRAYFSSVKIADSDGLYITISFMDKYKTLLPESGEAIREIIGEKKYPEWFEGDHEVTMKPDLSPEDKRDFFASIGVANVTRYLNVKKTLKPTSRFTQEAYTVLTAEQLAQLERVGVSQVKAVKI